MFCPVNYSEHSSVTNEFNTTVNPLQYRDIQASQEVLSEGAYGRVSVTPEGVVKSYLKAGLEGLTDLAQEISVVRDLELPLNTPAYKSYIALPSAVDLRNMRTLMPRARTDLYHIIQEHEKNKTRFPNEQLVQIAYDLCMGLYNIHYNNVAHLDIKPENVLLFPSERSSSSSSSGESFTYKYTDFGVSASQVCSGWSRNPRGTAQHIAPESILNSLQGKPSDIWALGVLFLHITYPHDETLWFRQWDISVKTLDAYIDLMLAATSPPSMSREDIAGYEMLEKYTFDDFMRSLRSNSTPLIPMSETSKKELLKATPQQLAIFKIEKFDPFLAGEIDNFARTHLYPSSNTVWKGLPLDLDQQVLGPLIRLMLNVDYMKRPSIDAIINNPLFARFREGRILPTINCYNNATMARQAYYPQGVQNIIDPMVRRTIMLVIYKAYPQQLGEASFIFDKYISMKPEVIGNATELIKVVLAAVYISHSIIHYTVTLGPDSRKLLQHQVLHKNLVDIDHASESLKSYTIPLDSSSPDTTMQRLSRSLMMISGFNHVMIAEINDVLTTLDFRLRPTLPEDYGSVSMTALNLMRVHGLPLTHPLNDIYRAAAAVKFELAKTPAPCALTPGAIEVLRETLLREAEIKTPSSAVGAIMPTIRSIVARFGGV